MLRKVMWVVKLSVFLVGIFFAIALLVHVIVPLSRKLVLSTLPALWAFVRILFATIYPLLIVNFIVAVIWVLSEKVHRHYHRHQSEKKTEPTIENTSLKPTNFDTHHQHHFPATTDARWYDPPPSPATVAPESEKRSTTSEPDETAASVDDEAISLDATWEMIWGGGDAPSRKALKKSETLEVAPPVKKGPAPEMKKSVTFDESLRRAPVLRKDVVVVCNEELNRKFDAFIKKVSDNIRLHRQASYERYVNLISHGASYYP